jgi:glycosyltransferase involved in cell wall biosynthesis
MGLKKRVIVSVINDLVTDQRVARTCNVLHDLNFDVLLIGRQQKKSQPLLKQNYTCKRLILLFEQGPAFYLFFNLRLFLVLLFNKADMLLANDLDTLLPNYLVSKIKRIPLIYDSHEIFCEVPELQLHKNKKKLWEKLESSIVPKLKYAITVNKSIADYFTKKYNAPFIFVRNIPNYIPNSQFKSRTDLNLPIHKKIILLQGAGINVQRGAEELLEAFKFLNDNYLLLIIGSGDVIHQLKQNVIHFNLQKKVLFINKISALELQHYTSLADLGITIDKDTNMNYHFSLPNKVFDYIHAGIPILASRLPEIEHVISTHQIGIFIDNHDPQHIAAKIEAFINSDAYTKYKNNTQKAALHYNWQNEKQKLITLIDQIKLN